MKKIFSCIAIIALISFVSCNLGAPSGIKIKTNAKYEFCILNEEVNLDDKFSVESMISSLNSDSSPVKMYGYMPGGESKSKQLAVTMPFAPIPLDFGEYLESVNFDAETLSVSNSFDIPAVNFKDSKIIDFDSLSSSINTLVTFGGVSKSESDVKFLINEGTGSFSKIVYSSGQIIIESVGQTDGAIVTITLENNKSLTGEFHEGKATLVVPDNTELTSNMKLKFDGPFIENIPFLAYMDSDSKVSKVEKLTASLPAKEAIDIDKTVALDFGDTIKNCTIGQGKLTFKITFPANWTGVNVDFNGSLSGALYIADLDMETDLSNKVIDMTNKSVNYKGKISASFENADIIFGDENPSIDFALELNSIKEAVISVGDDFNLSPSIDPVVIPEQITTMVDKIVWKESGVAIKLETNLDSANSIELKDVKCNFFGINKPAVTFGEDEVKLYCADSYVTVLDPGATIDFSADLNAFNYDSVNKTITLKNIETDKSYYVNMAVTPKIDWFKIYINPQALESAGAIQGTENTGLDKSSIFGSLDSMLFPEDSGECIADYVKIKSIPLYIFCNIPEALSGLGFSGTIKTYFGTQEGDTVIKTPGSEKQLLGTGDTPGRIDSVSDFILDYSEDKTTLVTDVSKFGVEPLEFRDVIWNSSEGSLFFDYNLSLSGSDKTKLVIVNPAHESEATEEEKVLTSGNNSIEVTIILPLAFEITVEKPLEIDLMKMLGVDTEGENFDIFGRTEPYNISSYEDYINLVKKIEIPYECAKLPVAVSTGELPDFEIQLVDKQKNENVIGDDPSKAVELSLEKGVITMEPKKILKAYPLVPSVKIRLNEGEMYIPQKMDFAAKLNLVVYANGEIDLSKNSAQDNHN